MTYFFKTPSHGVFFRDNLIRRVEQYFYKQWKTLTIFFIGFNVIFFTVIKVWRQMA